ncbi:MAG: amidohydrolase family protein [Parvibaculaceae bacterium]
MIIIRNADILVSAHDGSRRAERGDIVIDGDRIVSVGPCADNQHAGREIDASGMLAMPGLINGHFHSSANLQKGAVANTPLELFMLFEVPPFMDRRGSARSAYVRTMLGALEMLKQGVTAVHDDVFYVPSPSEAEIDAVMGAYRDSGMRATVTIDHPNVVEYHKYPYLDELLTPALRRAMDETPLLPEVELLALYRWFLDKWHMAEGGRLRVAMSCSAPQRVTRTYLQALSDLSRSREVPHNIHLLETRLQRVHGIERLGQSLVQYVREAGVLDRRTLAIHAIWIDDRDIETLAESGCTVAHNPVCNLKLGSGIMPFRRLRRAGVPIALGTDEAIGDDGVNFWTVMKIAGMIHNITDPEYRHWPKESEILDAATSGGARGMLQEDEIGCLKAGAQADIVLLNKNTLSLTPLNNLQHQLVYCENGSSVRTVLVAGKVVVENGKVLTIDEEALKAEARGLAAEVAKYHEASHAAADRLAPFYREMYLKSLKRDVGFSRWA